MSNQFLKLRRSAIQGRKPTTSSLDFGEIALNTYDGLAFMKKSGSNGEEIVTIGSTTGNFSGSFTGSLQGTASYALTSSYAVFANDYTFTSSLLEYYVDRRFSGNCEVTILSDKTISSSNASYLTQLSASRIGDPNHPWPDPWSANLRASASIASGQSPFAKIIVKSGNTYTYGSSVLTQNGDMTGSLTNNLRPDIAVSQSDYNLRAFDLISPNVEYYFEPESSLYNINKSWQQMLTYYTSSDWTIAPEFKIIGKGKFVNVYGQSNGFIAKWGVIYAPRTEITLEADHIIQNMWQGWDLYGQNINININKWWSYSGQIINTHVINLPQFNWPSQSLVYPSASLGIPILNININEWRWGENQFGGIGPHANDYWGGLLFGSAYGQVANINIKKITCRTRFTDGMFRFSPAYPGTAPTASNNTVNINVDYISGSRTNIGGPILQLCRVDGGAPAQLHDNHFIKVDIKKFDAWGIGLGSSWYFQNVQNCTFIQNCDDYRNYLVPNYNDNACVMFRSAWYETSSLESKKFINNQWVVSGNYRNYADGSPLVSWAAGNSSNSNNTLYSTLVLDNFKGYQLATQSNASVLTFNNPIYTFSTGSYVVVKDSLFYASGSNVVNNPISRIPTVIFNNTVMNRDIPSNINAEGTFNISSNLDKLIY